MASNLSVRRRWVGVGALLVALTMVVAGETVLPGMLGARGFLLYWLVCLGFTGLALLVATLDFQAIGRGVRKEERDLVRTTLKDIEREARNKPESPNSKNKEKH